MEQLKEMLAFTGIDVEQLVTDYTETLHQNNNRNATTEASIMALKEWARQKDYLIRQVMAMPGYNGNLQAVVQIEVPNDRKDRDVRMAVDNIWVNLFKRGNAVLKTKNAEGKTIVDLIYDEVKAMPKSISIKDVNSYEGKTRKCFSEFRSDGILYSSINDSNKANCIIDQFRSIVGARLTDEQANALNVQNEKIRAAENMKTTRAMGKVLALYGLENKSQGSAYGNWYISKYCEVMKEGGRRLTFVVSVNPIDYLKMSIGRFTSCHNINGGGWASGTISYMLDKVTLITYAIEPHSEMEISTTGEIVTGLQRPELFPKIYRNVFHWDELHRLIQSRVYPQGLEGCTDLYAVFRHKVQEMISVANGWETNNWTNRKRRHMDFTVKGECATNYADWAQSYMNANLSTPGHSADPYSTERFVIGAEPMCVRCGERHHRTNTLFCESCRGW